MKGSFYGLLLLISIDSQAADIQPFRTNFWGSLQYNYRVLRKWEWQSDIGYRRCNHFLRDPRQILVRSTLLYRFSDKVSAGAGFAWFGHTSTGKFSQEYRPFIQINLRHNSRKWTYSLRIRNEWRWYPQRHLLNNRTRLQIGARFNGIKSVQPYVTLEGFTTPGINSVLESRATLGVTVPMEKSAVAVFYTLQHQSTIVYGQHIIGIQYTCTAN